MRGTSDGDQERRELVAVRAGVRRLYGPVLLSAVVGLWVLVALGVLGVLIDRPPTPTPAAAFEQWLVALPRIGVGDTLAVLGVLATVVIALSLTADGAPRREDAASDLGEPAALARDLFREEITVAASAMGMLAAFMGMLGLVDAAEAPATFSTGPVGEAVAILALASVLAAVAAMADRHSSVELRAVEADVRSHAVRRFEPRLRAAVGGPLPRRWAVRPVAALRRPAAWTTALGTGFAVAVELLARVRGGGAPAAPFLAGVLDVALLTALVLVTSAAMWWTLARRHARRAHRVRRRFSVADVPAATWWLSWAGAALVVVVWTFGTGAAIEGPAERLVAWAAVVALVLPVPLWAWLGGRREGLRRRLIAFGLLTDRVPALRESYSQALRMRAHTGPET